MTDQRRRLPESEVSGWRRTYSETSYRALPWFDPRPTGWLRENVERGAFRAGTRVLDLGCGAGTNCLYLARAGFRTSGVDLAPDAIAVATARARQARVKVDLRVGDALDLPYPEKWFGGLVDVGCYHTLPADLRTAYARELARVLRPGGRLLLSCAAGEYRASIGPSHRLSVGDVTSVFEPSFLVRRVEFGPGWRLRLPAYHALLERRAGPQPPPR